MDLDVESHVLASEHCLGRDPERQHGFSELLWKQDTSVHRVRHIFGPPSVFDLKLFIVRIVMEFVLPSVPLWPGRICYDLGNYASSQIFHQSVPIPGM